MKLERNAECPGGTRSARALALPAFEPRSSNVSEAGDQRVSLQDEWCIENSNSEHFGLPQTRRGGRVAAEWVWVTHEAPQSPLCGSVGSPWFPEQSLRQAWEPHKDGLFSRTPGSGTPTRHLPSQAPTAGPVCDSSPGAPGGGRGPRFEMGSGRLGPGRHCPSSQGRRGQGAVHSTALERTHTGSDANQKYCFCHCCPLISSGGLGVGVSDSLSAQRHRPADAAVTPTPGARTGKRGFVLVHLRVPYGFEGPALLISVTLTFHWPKQGLRGHA